MDINHINFKGLDYVFDSDNQQGTLFVKVNLQGKDLNTRDKKTYRQHHEIGWFYEYEEDDYAVYEFPKNSNAKNLYVVYLASIIEGLK